MKKVVVLISTIVFFILSFLINWYSDEMFENIFIFAIIPYIFLMIIYGILNTICFLKVFSKKEYFYLISLALLFISTLLFFFLPFREIKVKYELDRYEEARLEIINMIKSEELKASDEIGNVVLPKKYKKYSSSGKVFLYQSDENGDVIGFWVFRGMLSGSVELIYSTGGERLIKDNETGHPIIKIKKLKDNWYYVITDY